MVTLLKSHVDGRLLYFVWVGVHSGCDSMVGLDVLVGLVIVLVYVVLMGCSGFVLCWWVVMVYVGWFGCCVSWKMGKG